MTTKHAHETTGTARRPAHHMSGRLRIQAEGLPWEVGAGELIALPDNLREPITALEETAFLLTVAWPAGAGAWEREMAGGRT